MRLKQAKDAAAAEEEDKADKTDAGQDKSGPESQPAEEAEASADDADDQNDGDKKEEGDKKDADKKEDGDEKKDDESGDKKSKKERKPLKKSVPVWASLSDRQKAAAPMAVTVNAHSVLVDAFKDCANDKGVASMLSLRKYVKKRCPNWPKVTFRQTMKRALNSKRVIQVRGQGLTGSFKLATGSAASAKQPSKARGRPSKDDKGQAGDKVKLDDLLPHIFTWVCEPKEASAQYIRKYVMKNYPNLNCEGAAFKKAIEHAEKEGQLRRISGKGLSGTFQLVDGARKAGRKYEDAFEDAVIAMNEPKDASVIGLRKYLDEYHEQYGVSDRPIVLKRALERCEERGWLVRVTGSGFSGSYRLAFPYYPEPRDLWRHWYDEESGGNVAKSEPKKKKKKPAKGKKEQQPKSKRSKYAEYSSSEEDESEEEEEEDVDSDDSDIEVLPQKKQRGDPAARQRGRPAAAAAPKRALATPTKKRGRPSGGATPKKPGRPSGSTTPMKLLKVPAKKRGRPKKH